MNYSHYEKEVEKLAIYPHANEGTIASVLYPTLGLSGETAETLEKIYSIAPDKTYRSDVLKECGDVLWYITRVAAELSSSLETVSESSLSINRTSSLKDAAMLLVIHVGRVSERVKKALRDEGMSIQIPFKEERRAAVLEDLSTVYSYLMELCHHLNSSIEEVSHLNLEKLSSRRDRGVIQGDGDER